MGEDFKRKRAESFTHLKDRAVKEFTMPNLFSGRPEMRFVSFDCEPLSEGACEGCNVSVVLVGDDAVQVWRGAAVVGLVREPGAGTIRDLMRANPDAGDMLTAIVDEHSPITGDFYIRLAGADLDVTDH